MPRNPEVVWEDFDHIRERLHFYSDVLEQMPDGVLVFDTALRVIYANRLAHTQFNYSPHELIGLNVQSLIPDNLQPTHAQHVAKQMVDFHPRHMGTSRAPLLGRNREGNSFPCDIFLGRIVSGQGTFTVAVVRTMLYH